MPYVKKWLRELNPSRLSPMPEPGELNYRVTLLCNDYLDQQGLSYSTINAIIGVLECAKLELYRRIAVPYEEVKKARNGDVYAPEHTNGGI